MSVATKNPKSSKRSKAMKMTSSSSNNNVSNGGGGSVGGSPATGMFTSGPPVVGGGGGPGNLVQTNGLTHIKDTFLHQQSQLMQQQQHNGIAELSPAASAQQQFISMKQQQQQQMNYQPQNVAVIPPQQMNGYNNNHQQSSSSTTNPNCNALSSNSYNQTLSPNNNNVKQCTGCGVKIIDRFLLHAMDKYWHTGCLKCSCCQAPLGDIGGSCFSRNGMILCKNDYLRLFGNTGKCSGCNQVIPAQEFVMKAQTHVYHVDCFSCVVCHCKLLRGDRYTIYQGSLLCEHDFPKVVRGNIQIPGPPPMKVHKIC